MENNIIGVIAESFIKSLEIYKYLSKEKKKNEKSDEILVGTQLSHL